MYKKFLSIILICLSFIVKGQSVENIIWKASSERISEKTYKLIFETENNGHWDIYAPSSMFDELSAVSISFADSSLAISKSIDAEGNAEILKSTLFEGKEYQVFRNNVTFFAFLDFKDTPPANLQCTLNYTYGKGDEFFPGETANVEIALEGGKSNATRILIPNLNINDPLQDCGAKDAEQKSSLWQIFILGLLGGFLALLTPCVFPMIPLTVSFFTKHQDNKKNGRKLAILYGFFIFLIYTAFSIPFHLIGNVSPTIYNDISTNVYLNVAFFAIFIFFAISFFGYYEITLPSNLANSTNAKQGSGLAGVFFMAVTLAIVSFSCTGPILGTLLVGTATEGAWPLTAGLAGFGVALGLPFALFALFPQWLNSLPKSGGWLNTVKVFLGFIELALALKFLSNADLVAHWSLLKREIFFAIWILIFIALFLYLMGWIRFPHDSKGEKIGGLRKTIAIVVLAFTLYLMPGVSNTKYANLSVVSGFPPPVCYSVYQDPINCDKPLTDYDEALKLAKKLNKPIMIDFTGWACVNCRKMEENVWTKTEVKKLMEEYILVSLYVDDKKVLPASEQQIYTSKNGNKINITTVGSKWGIFQTENFNASSQPLYVLMSPEEKLLNNPVGYTPNSSEYALWLECGLNSFRDNKVKK